MKPTRSQEAFLVKCFGCARFVYNHALRERLDTYTTDKKSLSFFDQCASLRELKKQDEYSWLNDVPMMMLQYSLLNLSNAYGHFFKTKSGFPKYKSKKRCRDSVKFEPNSTRYDFDCFKVRVPKLGWVRLCHERTFDPTGVKVNSTTVSRDACGTYWCTVSVDDGLNPEPKAKVREETAVGVDVGIKDFAVLSDGDRIPNLRFTEKEEKHTASIQRGLARKRRRTKDTPASKRYERYRVKLARIHRRTENRRTDYLHKLSTGIVCRYNTVCIEDLNVKGMIRNHSLAGAISSASWSAFVRMLEYKSEWYGVNLLKAGRFDPTSQTCSACGYRNADVRDLSVREWTCPQCGKHHDRDVNAAVNIVHAAINKYFNTKSPAVTGITDADGADSESKTGTCSPTCDYASDETSMQNVQE
jgi:putative transposase